MLKSQRRPHRTGEPEEAQLDQADLGSLYTCKSLHPSVLGPPADQTVQVSHPILRSRPKQRLISTDIPSTMRTKLDRYRSSRPPPQVNQSRTLIRLRIRRLCPNLNRDLYRPILHPFRNRMSPNPNLTRSLLPTCQLEVRPPAAVRAPFLSEVGCH